MKVISAICCLLLCIVCNAAATKWASVDWTSGTYFEHFKDAATGKKITSDMGYSMQVIFYDDLAEAQKKGDATVSAKTFFVDNSGELGVAGAITSFTEGIFDMSKTYYVKAIVENSSYIRSTDVLTFEFTGTGDSGVANINFITGGGLEAVSGGSNTWGDWTEKGGDVPEPTTCSLLLVGLAGMGLKRLRKRGKTAA